MGSESNPIKHQYNLTMSKRTRRPMNLEGTESSDKQFLIKPDETEQQNVYKVFPTEIDQELVKPDVRGNQSMATSSLHRKKASVAITENTGDQIHLKELAGNEKVEEKSIREEEEEEEEDDDDDEEEKKCCEEEEEEVKHHLQLVTVHRGAKGAKFGRMVRRYMKVLSHLIKVNKDHQLGHKKPVLQLTM